MQHRSQSGVTLLEIVIAIAVLNLVLIPILGTLNNLLRYHSTIRNRFQANLITQRQLETAINVLQSHDNWTMIATSDNDIVADVIDVNTRGASVTYALATQPEDGSTIPYFDTTPVPQTITVDDGNTATGDKAVEYQTQITLQPVCRDATTEQLLEIDTTTAGYDPNNHCDSTSTVDQHSIELVAHTQWTETRTNRQEQVEMRTMVVNLGLE